MVLLLVTQGVNLAVDQDHDMIAVKDDGQLHKSNVHRNSQLGFLLSGSEELPYHHQVVLFQLAKE